MATILQATPATHVRWALGPKAILDELWGNNILKRRQRSCHDKVLRHDSLKCGQTWYSSLRPGTITSWQKLKDMLVTSFQGFQTKPVTAQALLQCTQDQEEYLQAYVRRFLRLRAQAPMVPNEIVIEAMIKGLRPGPMAQYFTRKPPRLWRSCFRKWTSTFRLIMTSNKEGRKPTDFLRWLGASEEESTLGMSDQSIAPVRTTTKEVTFRDDSKAHSLQDSNKAYSGHQLQGAKAVGASVEDMGISPGKSFLILWWGQEPQYKNVLDYHSEAKSNWWSRSSVESAKASPTYCFVPLSLYTRICRQLACSVCCFGKPFSGFLASAPTATTTATYLFPKPAARRAPAFPTTTWIQGGIQSSYSQ
jgi:hypothetical protein